MSSNAKAAIIVVVAFVAGLFVGVAGDRLVLFRTGRLFPRRATDAAASRLVSRLDHDLNLSPAQHAQVQKIVDAHHARITNVYNNVRPQVHSEIEAANREIENVLTPEQRTKFRDMRARAESRRHHFL